MVVLKLTHDPDAADSIESASYRKQFSSDLRKSTQIPEYSEHKNFVRKYLCVVIWFSLGVCLVTSAYGFPKQLPASSEVFFEGWVWRWTAGGYQLDYVTPLVLLASPRASCTNDNGS